MKSKIGAAGVGLCCLICLATPIKINAQQQTGPVKSEKMDHGKHRFLLVFSPDNLNEMLQVQDRMLQQAHLGVEERDIVVLQVIENKVQASADFTGSLPAATALREEYKVKPDHFTLILVGKDGDEKYRATHAQAPAVLFQIIDAMPMRQNEIKVKADKQ